VTQPPSLVALDIDGTLVDEADRATPAVHAAVRSVLDAGVPLVLATGRAVYGVQRVIADLGLTDGLVVASNGAVIFSYAPVEVLSTVTFDPRPAVEAVLEQVPDALVAVEVVGDGYRINRPFPDGEITGQMWVESLDSLVREPVTRVIIRDPQSSVADFVRLAESLGLHGINYFVGYTAWLDLAPEGVSKASGLQIVCERLGVHPADVLAIGDGRNDVEMLSWAGRGVAMGQAPDEVRAVADAVTGSLGEDGAAHELGRWFPIAGFSVDDSADVPAAGQADAPVDLPAAAPADALGDDPAVGPAIS
jgi:hydroxymethylpyrimidine pyrophosphatase-like HAD family hydrolase